MKLVYPFPQPKFRLGLSVLINMAIQNLEWIFEKQNTYTNITRIRRRTLTTSSPTTPSSMMTPLDLELHGMTDIVLWLLNHQQMTSATGCVQFDFVMVAVVATARDVGG